MMTHKRTTDRILRCGVVRLLMSGLIVAVFGVGCGVATVSAPLTIEYGGNDLDSQLEFWHRLASRPVTCNDEAFHGLLLYIDNEDSTEDYAGRVEALRARHMLPKGFDRPAEEAVLRGTIAYAIVRMLDIRGGLIMSTFGPSPRYATRELQHMKLYPPSSPHQTFSGTEFLGIIGRVEDFQRLEDAKDDQHGKGDESGQSPPRG